MSRAFTCRGGRGSPTLPRWAPTVLALLLSGLPACGEDLLPLGAACASDAQCASGLCYTARCLDPQADPDSDGLTNLQERDLRTDPDLADTDGDGIPDGVEVGDPLNPHNSDGTGAHDALESAIADADRDCIKDQFDPDDTVPETDLSVVARAACKSAGVCGHPDAVITAECRRLMVDGVLVAEVVCHVDAPGYEPVETTCDGLDNDCNGLTDDKAVYVGPDGVPRTVGEPCQGFGACAAATGVVECGTSGPEAGRAVCSVGRGGSAFVGADFDTPCNNIDDDCNGVTDDGVVWSDPVTGAQVPVGQPCRGRGVCGDGVVQCQPGLGVGVCSTEPGGSADASGPETCDGRDEDCDGHTDEGFWWTGADGVARQVGEACGLGACAGGVVVCKQGEPACSTEAAGTGGLETCDGVDEDCDGHTDEAEGLLLGCPSVGVCAGVAWAAASCDGGRLVCEGEVAWEPDGESLCDGLDNDCDGEIDEGLVTPEGQVLGAPCIGRGACLGMVGVVACGVVLDPAWPAVPTCSANLGGSAEVCNGVDDDCNGLTDDGVGSPPELACATLGVCADFADPAVVCGEGVWACAYEASPAWEAEESLCDGLDNDCDGLTDEGTPHTWEPPLVVHPETQPAARVRWLVEGGPEAGRYLFGGWTPGPAPTVLGDLWRFEADGRWTRLAAEGGPGPRAGHAAAWLAHPGLLLVAGGASALTGTTPGGLPDGPAHDDLWAYAPSSGSWLEVEQLGPRPARRHATLTAVGPDVVLLAGGLADDPHGPLLLGEISLDADADGTPVVRCQWHALDAPAEARFGHAAAWVPALDRLVLAGGLEPDGGSPAAFAQALVFPSGPGPDAEVQALACSAPSTTRLLPAATVAAGVQSVVVAGGRGPDGPSGPGKVYADAIVIAPDGGAHVLAQGAAGAPATWGAAAWADPAGGVRLAGGVGGGVARRAVWPIAQGPQGWAWGEPAPWLGPAPRYGAAFVTTGGGTQTWLLGGTEAPLVPGAAWQDIWALEPTPEGPPAWKAVVPSGNALTVVDLTRPSVFGAVATWDPVGGRALLFGGVTGAGQLATDLWAFDPVQGTYTKTDAQGATPPGAAGTVFTVAPQGTTAWLVGVGAQLDLPVDAEGAPELAAPTISPEVHALSLATLTWSPVPGHPAAPPPADVVGLAGGAVPGALHVAVLHGDTALTLWRIDPATGAWERTWPAVGAKPEPTGWVALDAHVFEPASDQALIVTRDAQGQSWAVRVDFAQGDVALLQDAPLAGAGPGFALGRHLHLGAVGFGGADVRGVVRSVVTTVGHTCQP